MELQQLISSGLTRLQLLEIARLVMGYLKTSGKAEVEISFGFISHVALDQKWVDERIEFLKEVVRGLGGELKQV
jgi:hypothetical protein